MGALEARPKGWRRRKSVRIEAEKKSSRNAEGRKKAGPTARRPSDQPDPKAATQLHRSGKPHHEVEGWLRPSLQCHRAAVDAHAQIMSRMG